MKRLSVRPITVLSRLYRQWSRCRSIQVLKHLGSQLPPEIGGIASNVSADILVAYVADQIDEGLHSNSTHAGIVVDLTKAFKQFAENTSIHVGGQTWITQRICFRA